MKELTQFDTNAISGGLFAASAELLGSGLKPLPALFPTPVAEGLFPTPVVEGFKVSGIQVGEILGSIYLYLQNGGSLTESGTAIPL